MIRDFYVPTERSGIGHNHIIADHAVMADVDTNHEETVRTNRGHRPAHGGATMHRDVLPDYVPRADFKAGRLALVAGMLRRPPKMRE